MWLIGLLFFSYENKNTNKKKVSSDSVHGSPLDFKLLCVVFFLSSFLSHFSIITMKLHKLCWCIYSHVREYERMCLCASVCVYPYKFNPLLCHFLFLLLLLLFVLNILLNYIFDAFLILYTVFAVLISLRDYFFFFFFFYLLLESTWFLVLIDLNVKSK